MAEWLTPALAIVLRDLLEKGKRLEAQVLILERMRAAGLIA